VGIVGVCAWFLLYMDLVLKMETLSYVLDWTVTDVWLTYLTFNIKKSNESQYVDESNHEPPMTALFVVMWEVNMLGWKLHWDYHIACKLIVLISQVWLHKLMSYPWPSRGGQNFFSENPWQFHMINVKGK
jgi:hypothetical protein